MRPLRCDLADQLGDLFVGQVPASLAPAVEEHERFVQVVRLDVPELFGGLFLRAMPAVVEQGDVALSCLAKDGAERIDDGLAGRLGVL